MIKKLSSANAARFHTKHIEGDSLVRVSKAQSQEHQVGRAGLSFWPEELCGPHGSSNGNFISHKATPGVLHYAGIYYMVDMVLQHLHVW